LNQFNASLQNKKCSFISTTTKKLLTSKLLTVVHIINLKFPGLSRPLEPWFLESVLFYIYVLKDYLIKSQKNSN